MTGSLNTLGTKVISYSDSILNGDVGTIVVTLMAITFLGVLVHKFGYMVGLGSKN